MKNFKIFSFILLLWSLCFSVGFGQGVPDVAPNHQWPVKTNHVNPHNGRMAGTPTEYRSPYNGNVNIFGDNVPSGTHRYHQGVDVSADNGASDNVYSIETGTPVIDFESAGYNSRIRLGTKIYWHTEPLASHQDNVTQISGNDHLGDMSSDHVHLQPTIGTINGTQNYLTHLLPGFVDSETPEITNNWYYHNGHSKTNNTSLFSQVVTNPGTFDQIVLYDKVDLVVQTLDVKVDYDGTDYNEENKGNIGPNQLSYNVLEKDGITSNTGGEILNFDFTTLAGHTTATNVFGFNTSCCGIVDFRYILTSHPHTMPYDRFWNTRLREGQTENWDVSANRNPNLDARINLEAQFKDGEKIMAYKIRDLDEGGAAGVNESTTFDYVIIDNFKPFITRVVVSQVLPDDPDYIVYYGEWEWSSSLNFLNFGPLGNDYPQGGFQNPANSGYPLQVEVVASEALKSLQINGFENHGATAPLLLANPLTATTVTNNQKTFHFEIDLPSLISSVPSENDGYHLMEFEGEDLAGNDLIGYERYLDPGENPSEGYPSSYTGNDIPVKESNANNVFSTPAGAPTTIIDKVHGFLIEESCVSGNLNEDDEEKSFLTCLEVDFTTNQTTAQVGVDAITISPIVTGGTGPYEIFIDYGDGNSYTANNINNINNYTAPGHVYNSTGLKTLSLTVTDNDDLIRTETKTQHINVYSSSSPGVLSAYFTTFPLTPISGTPIQFNEVITGGIPPYTLSWNFGDGTTGSGPNPSHTYASNGVYTVTLDVNDSQGVTSNYYSTIVVEAPFAPQLVLNNVNHTAKQATFTIQNLEIGIVYQMEWNFGDGTTLTNNATLQSHTYSTGGIKTVSVKITKFGTNQRTVTLSETFDILEYLVADFDCPSFVLPQAGTHNFNNTSNIIGVNLNEGVYKFKWEVTEIATGIGTSTGWQTGLNYNHTFPNQGFYEVKLKVKLDIPWNICWGPFCNDETTCLVEVGPCTTQSYPLPFEPIVLYSQQVIPNLIGGGDCSNSKLGVGVVEESIVFIGSSINPANYSWEFEAFRIKQNGKNKKTYTVVPDADYPAGNAAIILFDWDEFNNDNGDEQYYVRVTIRENGCNKKIVKDHLLCSDCNGAVFIGQNVPCPFNWRDDVLISGADCNKETDFDDMRPAYPTTRQITQTFVDRYINREAYLFNAPNLESQGNIDISGTDTISFQAGTEIRLKPGFEVTFGGKFAAVIGDEANCYTGPNLPLAEQDHEREAAEIKSLDIEDELGLNLSPNPASANEEVLVNFTIPKSQLCELRIVDAKGQLIRNFELSAKKGQNLSILPTEILQTGVYFIQLQTKDELIVKKLVIQNIY